MAFVVLSSVGGSAVGPIFGGLMQDHHSLEWNFWIQSIFGGVVQIAHFLWVSNEISVMVDSRSQEETRKVARIECLRCKQKFTVII